MTDRPFAVLVWRALLSASRTPALWTVIGAEIAFFSAYLQTWGTGIPLVDARPVLDQFATAQWILLGVSLPWAAARCGPAAPRDGVAQLAALGAVPPSSIVSAGVAALCALLLATAIAGLPFAVLAQQISAAPAAALWRTQLPLYALSAFVAPVTAACMLVVANRFLAWLTAGALTIAAMLAVPPGLAGAVVLAVLGGVVTAMLVSGADRRYWYLSEQA